MSKIAIQGHSTRGLDVIQILKSLGGKDLHHFSGKRETHYYFINAVKCIDLCLKENKLMSLSGYTFYTLEEYEQKYNNMETKRNIQIDLTTAKEWYKQGGDLQKIALQAFSEQELQELPKSWEEYCKINPYINKDKDFFIPADGTVTVIPQRYFRSVMSFTMSSKKRAEQFVILNKLLQIRDYYNQGWVPDWTDKTQKKYVITYLNDKPYLNIHCEVSRVFVFKTKELRDKFFKNFKEDLEIIKEFL